MQRTGAELKSADCSCKNLAPWRVLDADSVESHLRQVEIQKCPGQQKEALLSQATQDFLDHISRPAPTQKDLISSNLVIGHE